MGGSRKFSKILKPISTVLVVVALTTSIVASQMYAPMNFSSIGKQKTALTAFLRASVTLGDSYLIKQVFHDSLVAQYPVVFDNYLQESDWLERLRIVEKRAPMSRDILNAIAILLDRIGSQSDAKLYREKVTILDPMFKL